MLTMSKPAASNPRKSMSKTPICRAVCRRVRIGGAGGRRNVVSHAAANSLVFTCALKLVTVAELFLTEFQTAGAVILNALDWKLILSLAVRLVVDWRISQINSLS